MFTHISFANPAFLFLLLLIPVLAWWSIVTRHRAKSTMRLADISAFKGIKTAIKTKLYGLLLGTRLIAISLIILALARPQSNTSKNNIEVDGVDIILAMDISGSMLAQDFKPNRLEAAKQVALDFIEERQNDRIGLVVFSGESFTQCPLTTDHSVVKNLFTEVKTGVVEDGTAIGNGLATAINRLKESKAKSKVIILMTDGVNNSGEIDPLSASEMANLFGIRVYTIGIGSIGMAPYPVQTPFGMQLKQMEVEIDEPLLKNIASNTDGKYFRATNKKKLAGIYQEIDQLEKSKIEVTEYRRKSEEFFYLAFLAGFLLLLEFLLKQTYLRTNP